MPSIASVACSQHNPSTFRGAALAFGTRHRSRTVQPVAQSLHLLSYPAHVAHTIFLKFQCCSLQPTGLYLFYVHCLISTVPTPYLRLCKLVKDMKCRIIRQRGSELVGKDKKEVILILQYFPRRLPLGPEENHEGKLLLFHKHIMIWFFLNYK